jgi:putative inorganic carbon (hco3(-)) transporter
MNPPPGLRRPITAGHGALAPPSRVPAALVVVTCVVLPIAIASALASVKEVLVSASALLLIIAVIVFTRPFWGLLFYIVLLYVRPEDTITSLTSMRMTLLVAVVTLLGTWFRAFLDREPVVRTPVHGLLVGFLLATLASTVVGGYPAQAAEDIGKLVVLSILVLHLVRTPARFQALVTTLILMTMYLAVDSLYLYHSGEYVALTGYRGGYATRLAGTGMFNNANELALALVPGLALAGWRLVSGRTVARLLYVPLIGIILWAILLTQSRGGLLATLTVVAVAIIAYSRNKPRNVALAVIVCVVLMSLVGGRQKDFDNQEGSANMRFRFWVHGVELLAQYPLTGVGYKQMAVHNGGYNAHNTFVIAFAETGLFGYFCWVGCLYYGFRRAPREYARVDAPDDAKRPLFFVRVAIIGYQVACFFGNETYMPITFILFALPLAQQIAYSGRGDMFRFSASERFSDAVRIAALCGVSSLFFGLIVPYII